MDEPRLAGVIAPALTPFGAHYAPDVDRFARHCQGLLRAGCSGLAVFGTTGEGNSLSLAEKLELLEALVERGVPPELLMPGTGCCALSDSLELTRRAQALGCGGVLMLPPFYYKGVSEDGLYRAYAEVIERVGSERLHLYLYHIPALSQVPIPFGLIERLLERFPGELAGIKDSSGDWSHTQALLERFADRRFDVFVGSEEFLLENLRAGGKGCITATANIQARALDELFRGWRGTGAEPLQGRITRIRRIIERRPAIPALKAVLAHCAGDAQWRTLRPPLVELSPEQEKELLADLEAAGFALPSPSANRPHEGTGSARAYRPR
jgi:4-hydroxy-tetrahydrodipicolinate synthase